MKLFHSMALVLGMMASSTWALSLVHMQQQQQLSSSHKTDAVSENKIAGGSAVTDMGLDSFVGVTDPKAWIPFVKHMLAKEDKFVPQDQEAQLAGFINWFSSGVAPLSFRRMRTMLEKKSWVKDLKTLEGANVTEADYQAVAALHNETAMRLFATALLKAENRFVPEEQESELAGFINWFSGSQAIRTLDNMRKELLDKPWVRKLKDLVVGIASPGHAKANASADATGLALGNATAKGTLEEANGTAVHHRKANATAERKSKNQANTTTEKTHHPAANATAETKLKMTNASADHHKNFNGTAGSHSHGEANTNTEQISRKTNKQVAEKTELKKANTSAPNTVHHAKASDDVVKGKSVKKAKDVVAEVVAPGHKKGNDADQTKSLKEENVAVEKAKANASSERTSRREANATEQSSNMAGNVTAEDRSTVMHRSTAHAAAERENSSEVSGTAETASHRAANTTSEKNVKDTNVTTVSHSKANGTTEKISHRAANTSPEKKFKEANVTATHVSKASAAAERKNNSEINGTAEKTSHKAANTTPEQNFHEANVTAAQHSNASAAAENETAGQPSRKKGNALTREIHALDKFRKKMVDKVEKLKDIVVDAVTHRHKKGAETCGACIVWGEANILSFNAYHHRALAHPYKRVELYARRLGSDQHIVSEEGTYWLVNLPEVKIQGRYWHYNISRDGLGLGALAISGPIIGNDIMVIRARHGPVTLNGVDIMEELNSTFASEFVKAEYVPDVGAVAGDTHHQGFNVEFTNGVRLTIVRYRKKLTAKISLCGSHVGAASLEGQCGDLQDKPRESWLALQKASAKLPEDEQLFSVASDDHQHNPN